MHDLPHNRFPARAWHAALKRKRDCIIDTDCVWRETGAGLVFNEVNAAGLSTIDDFTSADLYESDRADGRRYEVETASLMDLLERHAAPNVIDYLLIDTEGSEPDILAAFDFSAYDIRLIACEHNHTPKRNVLYSLLTENGFVRVMEQVSQFDDWYVEPPRA